MTNHLNQQAHNSRLEFGSRLQRLREDRGVTRPALAKSTGIPLKSIEKFEHGTMSPNVERLALLADALDVETETLVKSKPDAPASKMNPLIDGERGGALLKTEKVLTDLDQMREEGFEKYWRTAPRLMAAANEMIEKLSTDQLLDLAEYRDLMPIDENDYEPSEVVERIMDTAYFGVDLVKIELSALEGLADSFELEGDEQGWFERSWSGREVLLAALRPVARKSQLAGRQVALDNTEKFPFHETA